MKNSIGLIAGLFCTLLIGFSIGYQLAKKETPIVEEVPNAVEEVPFNSVLIVVHSYEGIKKGQFVYIRGVANGHLVVSKLEHPSWPPDKTLVYVVHSVDGNFAYIKRL